MEVKDSTGSETTFVLFDEEAEKLLHQPAREFVAKFGTDSKDVPTLISGLIGKTYVFRIKLTDYNLKDGHEDYTINKVFEMDDDSVLPGHPEKVNNIVKKTQAPPQ